MGHLDPIAYTYDADYHCPRHSVERFGSTPEGWVPEDAEDSEGNPVGAVFSWDEWWEASEDGCQSISCADCLTWNYGTHYTSDALVDAEIASIHGDGPMEEAARTIGADHGRAAASWAYDGNTPDAWYVDTLRGLEDGDPAVYDRLPGPDLSGQWADGYSSSDLQSDTGACEDCLDDVCRAYEDAYSESVLEDIEAVCIERVGDLHEANEEARKES